MNNRLLLPLLLALPMGAFCQEGMMDTSAKPEIFAPGIVSTPYEEWATSFSPDGHTVYWSQGGVYWTIVSSVQQGEQWSKPRVLPFSGRWNDTDPFVSPDGKRLFFVSNRPISADGTTPEKSFHLWYVNRLPSGEWSAPQHIDSPVNVSGVNCYAPSISRNGTLWFCSRGRDGYEGMAMYYATWNGTAFDTPKRLPLSGDAQDPFISADDKYLVFVQDNDIVVSFRQGQAWSTPRKFGPSLNNGDSKSSPYVTADGSMLYFSSNRVQGFYKRDRTHALDYDGLLKEMQNVTNGSGNILRIAVHLPATT